MNDKKQILDIFRKNNGYARTKHILDAGLHHRYLDALLKEGIVVKLKRGLYKLSDRIMEDELEDVARIVPKGVVCLYSAWNYYELTNFVPPAYHIAVERSQKISLPDYPSIEIYYWNKKYWSLGVTSIKIGDTKVNIYDREKCVCDAIRYRNKFGKEVEKEVLSNYLKLKDRNINQLLTYARILRVKTILSEYLEILL